MKPDDDAFLSELEESLTARAPLVDLLGRLVHRLDCTSGTIHLLERDEALHLRAHVNIPAPVLERIAAIPVGKGMAGLAVSRAAPVSICDLATDTSGDARPGARATGLRGTVAVPIFAGDRPVGALGVGSHEERAFSAPELDLLDRVGRLLGRGAVRAD
jgi:GAF domain-containing protein